MARGPLAFGMSRDTVRSYALFAAAALAPAIALGILGFRALRNEEAAILRETAGALDAAAERASATIQQDTTEAARKLSYVGFDVEPSRTEEALRSLTPPFAEPVVLGADLAVLMPPAPPRVHEEPPRRCAELLPELARAQ